MKLLFKLMILSLLTVFCILDSVAQSNIGDIKLGENIPDFKINTIINYPTSQGKISDFKDKLLILGYWTKWCVPCLNSWPIQDSLQHVYNDRVQFMPITMESKLHNNPESFFNRISSYRDFIIPTAIDSILAGYLAEQTGGYHWIYKGRYVGSTDSKGLTKKNIEEVLSGGMLFPLSKKELPKIFNKSLILSEEGDNYVVAEDNRKDGYHLLITSNKKGYESGFQASSNYYRYNSVDSLAVRFINTSLGAIYRFAYGISETPIYEISCPDNFFYPRDSQDLYCLELFVPKIGDKKLFRGILRKELQRVFGYYLVPKLREDVPTLVLRVVNEELLSTTGGESSWRGGKNFFVELNNYPLYQLGLHLKRYMRNENIPFFKDETGELGNKTVDITLEADLRGDTKTIAMILKKYGLELTIEKQPKIMWIVEKMDKAKKQPNCF